MPTHEKKPYHVIFTSDTKMEDIITREYSEGYEVVSMSPYGHKMVDFCIVLKLKNTCVEKERPELCPACGSSIH